MEDAVTADFLGRALEETGVSSDSAPPSPIDLIENQLTQAQKKLSRLYALYSEQDDDLLLDSINSQRKNIADLKARLQRERTLQENEASRAHAQEEIRQLAQAWPHMTTDERRAVLREAIDRVEINGDSISVHYRL